MNSGQPGGRAPKSGNPTPGPPPPRPAGKRLGIAPKALAQVIAATGGLPESADPAALSEDLHSAGVAVGLRDAIHDAATFNARVKDLAHMENLMRQVAALFGPDGRLKRRHIDASFVIEAMKDLSKLRRDGNDPPIEKDVSDLRRIGERLRDYARRADWHLRSSTTIPPNPTESQQCNPIDTRTFSQIDPDTWLIGERLPEIYKRHWGVELGPKAKTSIAFIQEGLRALGRQQKAAAAITQIIKKARRRRGTRPETALLKSPR